MTSSSRKARNFSGKNTAGVPEWDGQRETLEDLSEAVHYNNWIYGLMRPYLGSRILEVGCGTGNMTGYLLKHGKVLAIDVNQGYLDSGRRKFGRRSGLKFQRLDFSRGLGSLKSFGADTIVCVNVLEHIQGDFKFLLECLRVLRPGGKFLLFVPALQSLFGSMDRSYGHFRRYNKSGLESLFVQAGFQIEFCRYLNLLGIFGWWLNGKVLGRRIVPKGQMLLYDRIVSFTGRFEHWLPRPIGLSLFCVGKKD